MLPVWRYAAGYRPAFIRNPYFLLLLALLAVCLLVDQGYLLSARPWYVSALLGSCALLFVNFRLWPASLFAVAAASVPFVQHFPRQANHDNILTGVMLAVAAASVLKLARKDVRLSPALCRRLFRTALVTIYFLSGFHKLNSGFFNPCTSCADLMAGSVLQALSGTHVALPQALSYGLHMAVILMEMVVPFGLLHYTTRKYAAIALLAFHFLIAFYSYSNFSAAMVFLLCGGLLTPVMLQDAAPLARAFRVYLFFAAASLAVPFVAPYAELPGRLPLFVQGALFNIGMAYFAAVFFRRYTPLRETPDRNALGLQISVIVLLGCWSLKAYAGLGNAGNLTMFSNLVTERSRSNHFLIDTRYTKLTRLEEDHLLVLRFDDRISLVRITGMRLPKTEFSYRAAQWCTRFPHRKLPAVIVYRGDTIAIPDLHRSPFRETAWWYKYAYFRPFPDRGPAGCTW
jgi:hypothetical protein